MARIYEGTPLSSLHLPCQNEINQYASGARTGESEHCLEILQRAAQRQAEAVVLLVVTISQPLIRRTVSSNLREETDDIIQEVTIRLWKRFMHSSTPFRVTSFAAYRSYLKLTISSVERNFGKKGERLTEEEVDGSSLSPDETETGGLEKPLVQQETFQELLDMIGNPLQEELVRRRYALGESVPQMVEALQGIYPELNEKKIYRQLEYAIRKLRRRLV